MWNLPIGRRPVAKKDPAACPQRGENRESSGNTGQKLGNGVAAGVFWRAFAGADVILGELRWMRACAIDVMSLPSPQPAIPIHKQGTPGRVRRDVCVETFDHDFVI
jgi:hypothetical protein